MIVVQFLFGYLGAALIDIGLAALVVYLFMRYALGYNNIKDFIKQVINSR